MLKETKPEVGKRYFVEAEVIEVEPHDRGRPYRLQIGNSYAWPNGATKFYTIEPEQEFDKNNWCVDITDPVNAELLDGFKKWYQIPGNGFDFSNKYYGMRGRNKFYSQLKVSPPTYTLPELQKYMPEIWELRYTGTASEVAADIICDEEDGKELSFADKTPEQIAEIVSDNFIKEVKRQFAEALTKFREENKPIQKSLRERIAKVFEYYGNNSIHHTQVVDKILAEIEKG